MLWLYRFLVGFVTLEFSGDFPERIINISASERLVLWNLKQRKGKIRGSMSIRDFRLLRKARKGKKIKIHIIKKTGFPFFKEKYKKRTGLILGMIMFFLIINLLSCFVWHIDIKGNESVSDIEILKVCKEIGINEGMAKKGFSAKNKRDELLLKADSLAWASLNIEGCFLEIEVTEVQTKAQSSEPTNLKASADGIIKKIDVKAGNCVVKVGDTVRKGDILVSGVIESASSTEFVHSIGKVTAVTERCYSAEREFIQNVSLPTGKKTKRSVLSFFGIKLPLYIADVKGEYNSELTVKNAELFEKELPASIATREYTFIKNRKKRFDEKALKKQLEDDIYNQISKDGITDYKIKDYNFEQTDKSIKETLIISAEENIAFQDVLLIYSGN